MMEQRSFEWFASRLGYFSGSEVGKLMVKSKKKGQTFGETAISYIMKKMGERELIDEVRTDEEVFNEYQYVNSVSSRAMQFGTENEPLARKLIIKELGETFEEVGSIPHPTVPWFSSSPDGLSTDSKVALEIKCPSVETFMRYKCFVKDGETLKAENSIYYYQALSHMAVTGAEVCIFVLFNPFLKHPLYWFKVDRNEGEILELTDRVTEANEYINNILNQKQWRIIISVPT